MSDVLSTSALALAERLSGIERDTETIYLELGKIFPAIKAAIDESAHAAEETIREILAVHRHGDNEKLAHRRMDDFIEDSSRFFTQAAKQEDTFSHIVEEAISGLSGLDEIIGRIRTDSEEMELVSLNAMTVALKSGAAGRAFSVITDELKLLSARTILHANDLSSVGGELLEVLGLLQGTLTVLAERRNRLFGAVQQALTQGFQSLDEQVQKVAGIFRDLASTAATVRLPVSEIMQGVQVQDIIRQSLDHVRLSLDAITVNPNGTAPDMHEERIFLAEISRLSSTLLDDVYTQVINSFNHFRHGMTQINGIVEEVEGNKALWLGNLSSIDDSIDFDALASDYIHGKNKVATSARHVAEGVKRVDERFRSVNTILSRFNNIVVVSRIEIARNKALSIVSNTVAGMMDLTERLGEDVSAAGKVTGTFTKTLGAELAEYLSVGEESTAAFDAALSRLHDEFTRLGEARTKLGNAARSFHPFSSGFSTAIARAMKETDSIQSLADELAAMRDKLADYATDAESELGVTAADTSSGGLVIRNQRLREIVERFTIFTHRQAAARIAHLEGQDDTETGATGGDVTLF